MKIGILGTGSVGQHLAKALLRKGHEIIIGTRDPSKKELIEWKNQNAEEASLQTFKECASNSEFLILAVNFENLKSFFEHIQGADIKGKTLIDLSNPLDFSTGSPELAIGFNDSVGEIVQENLPEANVVKSLNCITGSQMIDPKFEDGIADMFMAGDSDEAKAEVKEFLESVGWRVIDIGGIKESRLLEPFAMIWIKYSIAHQTGAHGFSMLRK